MNVQITKPDQVIRDIINTCFPDYQGRKFFISTNIPKDLRSYWDGGSRDYFCFYNLRARIEKRVESNHPVFEPNNPNRLESLPEGIVLVKHSYFCGKDMGITIFANECDLVPMIPEKVCLSETEKKILYVIKSYKSNYRTEELRRFFISENEFSNTKEKLIEKGMIDRRGSITIKGKNAIGNTRF